MAAPLDLTICDPRARVIALEHGLWITSGLDEPAAQRLEKSPCGDVAAALCRHQGDATIIGVGLAGGVPNALSAWRGLTSGHDVFYRITPDGRVAVSDHFRNILSGVPPAERGPDDHVLCDHFLFRTVPGENTFCRSVKRIARGGTIHIDFAGCRIGKGRFDRVEADPVPGTLEDHLERLDQALESVLARWRAAPRVAALFSGGVDSTLMQSYLDGSVPALFYELPWYSEAFESNYVARAADLLGISVEKHPVELERYLDILEAAIDATALPPPHLQLTLYPSLLRLPYETFLFGEQADALFGIELRRARLASPFTSSTGRGLLKIAGSLLTPRARRFAQIREAAARLAEPLHSLDGYAAQFGTYTDRPLLNAVFGESEVRSRLGARLDEALAVLPPTSAGSGFYQHVELAQMIDYLCEDILASFRHLAHAFGRSLVTPFTTRPLLDAAWSIPAKQRYLSGLEPKHLLKRLLQRRVPGYPVKQRKGYTHVPFNDLDLHGPLSTVWQHYDVPEPFAGAHRAALIETPSQMTWNAITLAIWQARVQSNPHLLPVPGSRAFRFDSESLVPAQRDV